MQYSKLSIRALVKKYHIQMVGMNDCVMAHFTDDDTSAYISYVGKSLALKGERPVFDSSPCSDYEDWVQNKLKEDYVKTMSVLADSFWNRFNLEKREIYGIKFNGENLVVVALEQDLIMQVRIDGVLNCALC